MTDGRTIGAVLEDKETADGTPHVCNATVPPVEETKTHFSVR